MELAESDTNSMVICKLIIMKHKNSLLFMGVMSVFLAESCQVGEAV
jgi:hypothetical protein